MLNKLNTLNYQFDQATGNITQIVVGFNNWTGEVQGNLNVTLTPEDGELSTLTPIDLQALAKPKALTLLVEEPAV